MVGTKKIQDFKRWVVRYKNFAIALPIVLILTSFFMVENIKKFQEANAENQTVGSGLNLELPGKDPQLDERDNGGPLLNLDNEAKADSDFNAPSIDSEQKSEKDSLQEIVKQLEALSFNGAKEMQLRTVKSTQNDLIAREEKEPMSHEEQMRKLVEDRLAYRDMLQEGKEKMMRSSGDIPTGKNGEGNFTKPRLIVKAAVYRDQFILPDDNVELILLEDLVHEGKRFEKNTFIYALASIRGNRVLLDIDNIDHAPITITTKDFRDGREGLYSKRAGELWKDFKAEVENDVIATVADGISEQSGGMVREMTREVGAFLRNKRIKERNRILLVDDRKVLLVVE